MRFLKIYFLFFIFIGFSCSNTDSSTGRLAFYHWKNETDLSLAELECLDKLKVNDIYLRFFDIDVNEAGESYPISVLKNIDARWRNYRIVPVVFITNKTFEKNKDVAALAYKVKTLIDEMARYHFDKKPAKIQIDCDWTTKTKNNYFEFLEILKKDYVLSATIRLHQVKYHDRTGIPPADEGSLMVYNMGNLEDSLSNSIFSFDIVKQYITPMSKYPLPLDVALPLFSWGIVVLPDGKIKILNNLALSDMLGNDDNYRKINKQTFQVLKPHFLKGFLLPINTTVKVEEVDLEEVIRTKKYLEEKCLDVDWRNTLLYHLDEVVLEKYSMDDLKKLR